MVKKHRQVVKQSRKGILLQASKNMFKKENNVIS